MIQPRGPKDALRLIWWMLRHERRSLLIATVVCLVTLPVHDTIAAVLLPEDLLQVLGFLLAFFLGFRYSQAYNRWWEARILWGALVNESRNWRDLLTTVLPRRSSFAMRQRLLQLEVLLIWSVNASLRSGDGRLERLPSAVLSLAESLGINDPSVQQVMQAMASRQRELVEQQQLNTIERADLIHVQQELTRAIGGLERIRSQPLPASSTFCIRALTWVYGYLVFLKLDAVGLLSAAVVGWLSFLTLLMAERIGMFLENPFRDPRFALPLDRICRLITANLLGDDHPLAQSEKHQAGPVVT
ncbi:MAG: bestrophin family ion channel [Cyanobacteriota bacterium]|nr:bestrophin family ion channel [Cyanobacteriota bacterium]